MSRWKTSEWCGVSGCFNPSVARGLCATHYKEHTEEGLHTQAVANDEITRLLLQKPTYHKTHLSRQHRLFAQSLPIPAHQQRALTRALNATALRRGVVK